MPIADEPMIEDVPRPLQLRLPGFEGDVDSLLHLLSLKKLAPTDFSVFDVTRQFAAHLSRPDLVDLEEAGALMAVSARLMLLKAAHLLVQPAPGDDEDDTFAPARGADRVVYAAVAARLSEQEGRESFPPITAPCLVERRVEPRSPYMMTRAWSELKQRREPSGMRVVIPAFVRLETAVSGLIRALKTRACISLEVLLRGSSRQDAVVHFIAVLELLRRREAVAVQSAPFEEIVVEYVDTAPDAASRTG